MDFAVNVLWIYKKQLDGKQEITYLTKVEISLNTIYTNVQNKNKISKMKNEKRKDISYNFLWGWQINR